MKKSRLIQISIVILFSLFSFVGHASFDETKARDFLNTTGEKFIETLGLQNVKEKYALLDDMFETKFDTLSMGRFVLGGSYRLLNEEQKVRYHELFKRYIKSLYKSYPLDFDTSEIHFGIAKITQNEKYISALVVVDLPEKYQTETLKTIRVEFKLKENPNGNYLISDILFADVSLLVSQKARFMQMLQNADGEIDWFLDDFEDFTISNENQILPVE